MKTEFGKSSSESVTYNLIQQRRRAELISLAKGELSFEALKSNSGLLPDKPEVNINSGEDDEDILKSGKEVDNIISTGLRLEIEKHGLQPDGRTFYLIDCGLPHLPVIQLVLLNYGIDPSIYTNPSEQTLQNNTGHFRRYVSAYREHAEELFKERD